ncbi:aspartate kinase [Albibacterium bauzanense]|uniref:Aspartokinase n=1 Tax=Albibacterium bauzanense TaxID=653929 RepID=A0A4R1LQK1_9SPHI|nr:aspartate kinase [Albibacterium bauzanense]TCK80747.1 aspartate kinase [Albibacterium bauzanense]
MQVFKFGGASVKNAESIKNLARIIEMYKDDALLVIVSAMDKTTNRLENLLNAYFNQHDNVHEIFDEIKNFHYKILEDLFHDKSNPIFNDVANTFVEIDWIIEEEPQDEYDYLYDQIVSIGEMVSTRIVNAYLQQQNLPTKWLDVRNYIHTDNTYREGNIDWLKTEESIQKDIPQLLENYIPITQGFLGGTSENFTTTLGREGSDYSAAVFAACLNAESVTIWKDVPGVLNADPKWFNSTELISELSYVDAIELSYYGASVIHPKTIKPLENKGIILNVRSFIDINNAGTIIRKTKDHLSIPSFIFKIDQVLISILPKDFSFILEDNLSQIFSLFYKYKVKINMMHNSAINFSVSVDNDSEKISKLIEELRKDFKVSYKENLELATIRYYNQDTIDRVLVNKEIILEVKNSYTCQMLIGNKALN